MNNRFLSQVDLSSNDKEKKSKCFLAPHSSTREIFSKSGILGNTKMKKLSGWEASCGTHSGDASRSQASCAGSWLLTLFSFDNPVLKKCGSLF